MLLLVYAVVQAQQVGWGSAQTIGSFVGVAALIAVFAVIELRSRDPLVRFGIFRSGMLRRANLAAVVLFGSWVSFQFLITQYLQTLNHWSALATAFAFLPVGVVVALLSLRMGVLLGRFGPIKLAATAFVCLVIAYAWFLQAGVRPDYPLVMLPSVILIGLAFGLGFASLSVAATAGVANEEQGLASSLFQTFFQVGGAVVLAIVTAVVDTGQRQAHLAAAATLRLRPALVPDHRGRGGGHSDRLGQATAAGRRAGTGPRAGTPESEPAGSRPAAPTCSGTSDSAPGARVTTGPGHLCAGAISARAPGRPDSWPGRRPR